MAGSAALMVVVGEQLCVRREMTEGLAVAPNAEGDEMEMGSLMRDE